MYTRCTKCQTLQTVTTQQLRTGQGMLRCKKKKCRAQFNALEYISDTKDIEAPVPTQLPWNQHQQNPVHKPYWRTLSILGFIALLLQFIYFEGPTLTQNPSLRPWLEKFCQPLACQLPIYRHLEELAVQGSLTTQPDQSMAFSAVISNHGAFPQTYPKLKLSLLDYEGMPFSQRIFEPHDYLPDASAKPLLIMADDNREISLSLAAPNTKVGGYTFELIN
jgi:hypothetical protein